MDEKDRLAEEFKELIHNGSVSNDVKAESLWEQWSLREKIEWFIANKLFKCIGSHARKKVDEFNEKLFKAHRDGSIELMKYPAFAIKCPKDIIVVNMSVKLATPIEFISINISIPKD